MSGALRIGLVLAAAVAATIVANFVLLGVATGRQEPVGRLSPRAELQQRPPAPRVVPPVAPVRPRENEPVDD